ncbi:hypothetical protein BH23CHL5_BH23CHL5_13920 [soil metagenome]
MPPAVPPTGFGAESLAAWAQLLRMEHSTTPERTVSDPQVLALEMSPESARFLQSIRVPGRPTAILKPSINRQVTVNQTNYRRSPPEHAEIPNTSLRYLHSKAFRLLLPAKLAFKLR